MKLTASLTYIMLTALTLSFPIDSSFAQRQFGQGGDRDRQRNAAPIPTQRRDRNDRPRQERPRGDGGQAIEFPTVFRSINGRGNNLANPELGMVGTLLLRLVPADYADGVGEPAGDNRPSARAISNACVAQSEDTPNSARASDYLWMWGQFVDHDIDLTEAAIPTEHFDIDVPVGDPQFDPTDTGLQVIPLIRSHYEVDADGVRQQVNDITAFIDASNVYGSDEERAFALRTLDGTGMLKTSDGDLLPFNVNGLHNAMPGGDPADFFLAGDVRANEQAALAAMHTLFVREHNHWATQLAQADPTLSGEEIYQMARAIVGAEMQAITYNEFLPLLLGDDALSDYRGYQEDLDPSIANCFSTAAFRLGHSMLSGTLMRLDAEGQVIAEGNLPLRFAFFNPAALIDEGGIDPLLRGLASQVCQRIDNQIIDDLRNFLFGAPGQGGFDLASLNIQRGRDHGLGSYNQTREAFGLVPAGNFADINSDPDVQANLAEVYTSVDDIDLWVGGLAESPVRGALVGPTLRAILADQYERLRDGDRFWYEAYLPPSLIDLVERQPLANIIRRNTGIGDELQDDVFRVPR